MSLIDNEFTGRNEVLFISYEDIIRCRKVPMLDNARKQFKDAFDHVDMTIIEDMDNKNLLRFAVTSEHNNPVREFFDEELLDDDLIPNEDGSILLSDELRKMFEQSDDLIDRSPSGRMIGVLEILFRQPFLEHVFIHSNEYDLREQADIASLFSKYSDSVSYVHGNFEDVIKSLDRTPTFYMFNDVQLLPRLLMMDKSFYEYTEINVADIGYNYVYDELNEVVTLQVELDEYDFKELIIKFGMFNPFIMDDTYFTSNDYITMLSEMFIDLYSAAETDEEKKAVLDLIKKNSDDIEDVKKNGDTRSSQVLDDGTVIRPGRMPDADQEFYDAINKL